MSFELPIKPFILAYVLTTVLELCKLRSTDRDAMGLAFQTRIDRAKDGFVSWRPRDWSETPQTAASMKRFSTALHELEEEGLVETIRDRTGRPTWLRLLPPGEDEAKQIAAKENIPLQESRTAGAWSPADRLRLQLTSLRKCAEKTRERIRLYEEAQQGYRREGYVSEFIEPEWSHKIPLFLQGERDRLAQVEQSIRELEASIAAAKEPKKAKPKKRKESHQCPSPP